MATEMMAKDLLVTSTTATKRQDRIAPWGIETTLAVLFLMAAGANLLGAPLMVDTFDQIGLGQWLRYVTGLAEVAGAFLLLWSGATFFGASLLLAISLLTIALQLFWLGGSVGHTVLLSILTSWLVWTHRFQGVRLVGKLHSMPDGGAPSPLRDIAAKS